MNNVKSQENVEVTNNDLARMIAVGFSGVDKRFDEVWGELHGMKKEIGGVKGEIVGIHDRLKTVESKLDRALYTEYTHLESRVTKLEKKVGMA